MKTKSLISFIYLLLLVIIGFFCDIALAQQTIEHKNPAFTLTIPDNFKPLPETLMPQGWLYGFKERTGTRDEPQITIGIEKSSELSKDKASRLEILIKEFSNPKVRIRTKDFYAKSAQIQAIEVTNTAGKVKSIMLIAELPAGNDFFRIIAGGNAQREQDISRIFNRILLSFIADDDHGDRYPRVLTVIVLCLAVFIIFFLKNKAVFKKE